MPNADPARSNVVASTSNPVWRDVPSAAVPCVKNSHATAADVVVVAMQMKTTWRKAKAQVTYKLVHMKIQSAQSLTGASGLHVRQHVEPV